PRIAAPNRLRQTTRAASPKKSRQLKGPKRRNTAWRWRTCGHPQTCSCMMRAWQPPASAFVTDLYHVELVHQIIPSPLKQVAGAVPASAAAPDGSVRRAAEVARNHVEGQLQVGPHQGHGNDDGDRD